MLTIRDFFAAVALHAYITATIKKLGIAPKAQDAAEDAYRYANEMMKEREK